MADRELRRSYTQVDFSVGRNKVDLTGKQQVRTNKKFNMASNRMKFPTLEIYRPPGQRINQELREGGPGLGGEEGGGGASSKLNVHAKEFVMNHRNQSQSLQTSKSTGNILAQHHNELRRGLGNSGNKGNLINNHRQMQSIQRSLSTATHSAITHQQQNRTQQPKIAHTVESHEIIKPRHQREIDVLNSGTKDLGARPKEGTELRRSKSLYVPNPIRNSNSATSTNSSSSSSSTSFTRTLGAYNMPTSLLNQNLPQEITQLITKALRDVREYSHGDFAQLARSLIQKADEERKYAEKIAEACVSVIEREPRNTFLEALVNFLIFTIEKKMEDPGKTSCHAMMAFLSHLYSQIKPLGRFMDSKLRINPHPSSQILQLLAHCCICTLKNPSLTQRNEIECLFFVVTTIGRELEQESNKLLDDLIDSVRDALYFSKISDQRIKKTLLQMLELHAANWQINAETLSFYQSNFDQLHK